MTYFNAINLHSTPEALVEQIINHIRAGKLQPGECLPSQRDLASMFRVGLGTIREALKILEVMDTTLGISLPAAMKQCGLSAARVVDCIEKGDPEEAGEAMHAHLNVINTYLWRQFPGKYREHRIAGQPNS